MENNSIGTQNDKLFTESSTANTTNTQQIGQFCGIFKKKNFFTCPLFIILFIQIQFALKQN